MSTLRMMLLLLLLGPLGCETGLGDACNETKDCRDLETGYCAVTGICVSLCGTAGEACGDGRCVEDHGRLVCLPSCDQDADCRSTDRCIDGACVLTDLLAEP